MTKLLLLAALAVGFVAFAPTASAADKAKKKKAEAPATVEGQFKALDTNADKKLSLDEFKAGIPAPKKTTAKKPLTDADKLFAKFDANSDNALSLDEFKVFHSANPTLAVVPAAKKKKEKKAK